MQKILKNYRTNLIIVFACFVITVLFNTHLFTSGNSAHLLYGVLMAVLGGLTLYCLVLINKNLELSTKIATIIGPVMALMSLIDGFMYGEKIIVNFRITGLFIMVGGVLLFNSARKIKKDNF